MCLQWNRPMILTRNFTQQMRNDHNIFMAFTSKQFNSMQHNLQDFSSVPLHYLQSSDNMLYSISVQVSMLILVQITELFTFNKKGFVDFALSLRL